MDNKLEIEGQSRDEMLILRLKGRIDAFWTNYLETKIDEEIRNGNINISLDLGEVNYVSSIGLRLFVKTQKALAKLGGQFSICQTSPEVKEILTLTGMASLFAAPPARRSTTVAETAVMIANSLIEKRVIDKRASFVCRSIGSPDSWKGGRMAADGLSEIVFGNNKYGIGIGAIGSDKRDCAVRLGEFIATANYASYQPTDDTEMPDFAATEGIYLPKMKIFTGLLFEGEFSHQYRFEIEKNTDPLPLGLILSNIIENTGFETCFVMMAAETDSFVGSALKRSPLDGSMTEHNKSTIEREYSRMTTLTAGLITKSGEERIRRITRLIDNDAGIFGHLHTALFNFVPLRKEMLATNQTLEVLYDSGQIVDVLHLLGNSRQQGGMGQTTFVQGNIWIGRIDDIRPFDTDYSSEK